jgi:hypothetical protein
MKYFIPIIGMTILIAVGCSPITNNIPSENSINSTKMRDITKIMTNTSTITSSPTITPTNTQIPKGTLKGTIGVSGYLDKGISTNIELRKSIYENDQVVIMLPKGLPDYETESDKIGYFSIENIMPGTYNIWIMGLNGHEMMAACRETLLPDDKWVLGLFYINDNNAYIELSKHAFRKYYAQLPNIEKIYFISPDIKIESGKTNEINTVFPCL